jgi:hypothetical protein
VEHQPGGLAVRATLELHLGLDDPEEEAGVGGGEQLGLRLARGLAEELVPSRVILRRRPGLSSYSPA